MRSLFWGWVTKGQPYCHMTNVTVGLIRMLNGRNSTLWSLLPFA